MWQWSSELQYGHSCSVYYRMWNISLFTLQGQNPCLLLLCIWRINTWKHKQHRGHVLHFEHSVPPADRLPVLHETTLQPTVSFWRRATGADVMKLWSSNTLSHNTITTALDKQCVGAYSGVLVSMVSVRRSPVLHSGCPVGQGKGNSHQPIIINH